MEAKNAPARAVSQKVVPKANSIKIGKPGYKVAVHRMHVIA